jgi:hypothetical protein
MSKKIAQLTKVIYTLNSKNDDQDMALTAVTDAYEEEIELMLKETYARINDFRQQLDIQRQQTDFDGKLREYQAQREKEKAEAMAEFEAFREKARANEVGCSASAPLEVPAHVVGGSLTRCWRVRRCVRALAQAELVAQADAKVAQMARELEESKRGFEGKLQEFAAVVQRLEERTAGASEELRRVHKGELEQAARRAQARQAEAEEAHAAAEAELRAQLAASLADDSAATAVRGELQAEVEALKEQLAAAAQRQAAGGAELAEAREQLKRLEAEHEAALSKAREEFDAEAAKYNHMLGDRLAEQKAAEAAHEAALAARTEERDAARLEAQVKGGELATAVSPKRLLDESPWLQCTSECQRFGPPPRLNK